MHAKTPFCLALVAFAIIFISYHITDAVPQQLKKHVAPQRPSNRLPRRVKPNKYNIVLDLSKAFEKKLYSGTVDIDIEFRTEKSKKEKVGCFDFWRSINKSDESSYDFAIWGYQDEIVMHADESVKIIDVKVLDANDRQLIVKSIDRDKTNQMIFLKMGGKLPEKGNGKIKMKFKGQVRDDNHGIYLSTDSTYNYLHVVANFQPSFARLAMPCFDEPDRKSTFRLEIKHASSFTAHANTELEKSEEDTESKNIYKNKRCKNISYKNIRSVFKETPIMSIHMVAFVVGKFDKNRREIETPSGLTIRYLSIPGTSYQGEYAVEVASKVIEWIEEYTDYNLPLNKLDIVAISDTDTYNTACWGLVFVRNVLIADDNETRQDSRVEKAVNVARLVAHQWFGNLISMNWWDNFWIIEGIAAKIAFEAVAKIYPEYGSEYFLRISTLSNVLASDTSGTMHPLSPPSETLRTGADIAKIFDVLTFMKSGALTGMIQNLVGYGFQRCLKDLIRQKKSDEHFIVDAFNYSQCINENQSSSAVLGTDIYTLIVFFPDMSSFPVLNVDIDTEKQSAENVQLRVYMEPYPSASKSVEYGREGSFIPEHKLLIALKALISDEKGDQNVMVELEFVGKYDASAKLPDWFDPNKHFVKLQPNPDLSTYYRIRYSDQLLERLKIPIKNKILAPMERLHILDDASALVSSGLMEDGTFRKLFESYAEEDDFAIIIKMLIADQTLSHLSISSTTLQAFNDVYKKYGFKVDGKETFLKQRARMQTLKALVLRGEKEVVNEALETFEKGNVAPFLREPVYAAVVKEGSKAQVEQLINRMWETRSCEERLRLASALALSDDRGVLENVTAFLNGRSDFKQEVLKSIIESQPQFALKGGKVVLKKESS